MPTTSTNLPPNDGNVMIPTRSVDLSSTKDVKSSKDKGANNNLKKEDKKKKTSSKRQRTVEEVAHSGRLKNPIRGKKHGRTKYTNLSEYEYAQVMLMQKIGLNRETGEVETYHDTKKMRDLIGL